MLVTACISFKINNQSPLTTLVLHRFTANRFIFLFFQLIRLNDEHKLSIWRDQFFQRTCVFADSQHLFAFEQSSIDSIEELSFFFIAVAFFGLFIFGINGFFEVFQLFKLLDKCLCELALIVILNGLLHGDFSFIFFCVVIYFGNLCFCICLDLNQLIFNFSKILLFFQNVRFKFAQHFSYFVVFLLVNEANWFECMCLMLTKHLALAASRFIAVLTKIIQIYAMVFASLHLFSILDQVGDNLSQLVEEARTICQLSFYFFSTVWTLRFQFKTFIYAGLTVEFGTIRTHCRLGHLTVAYLTIEQFVEFMLLFNDL